MAKVRQRGKTAVWLILGLLLLNGCGAVKVPDTIEETSLIIDQEGEVTSYTVGFFDKSYYDLKGLRDMAQEEASAYNTKHQKGAKVPVELRDVTGPGEGGKVIVTYHYDGTDTYTEYCGIPLFFGTVEQARVKGHKFVEMNQVLFNMKGNESILSAELDEDGMLDRHLLLIEEPTYVFCPYKVAYISEGAGVLKDGSIDTTGVDPEAYPVIIVMAK